MVPLALPAGENRKREHEAVARQKRVYQVRPRVKMTRACCGNVTMIGLRRQGHRWLLQSC
jgi:hypothetical protein